MFLYRVVILFKSIFFSKHSLKGKLARIEYGIARLFKNEYGLRIWIWKEGFYEVDPESLKLWICLKTDHDKHTLVSDELADKKIRNVLVHHNYPKEAINLITIDFESEETVRRDSNGNWWVHFK